VRYRKAIGLTPANATFIVAFFGSLALFSVSPPEPAVAVLWFLTFIIWAAVIRWWIVVGIFAGYYFFPVQASASNAANVLAPAVAGAILGLTAEVVWWLSADTRAKPSSETTTTGGSVH
jgi:hypothetical protein